MSRRSCRDTPKAAHEESQLPCSMLRLTARCNQRQQIFIRIKRWRCHFNQYVECREVVRVFHQRRVDQAVIDCSAVKLGPDPRVLASRLLFRRMGRPIDAQMPKKIQTNRDSAAALIESCVEISEQASDAGTFRRRWRRESRAKSGAPRPLLIHPSETAFAPVKFNREGKCAPALPSSLAVVGPHRHSDSGAPES